MTRFRSVCAQGHLTKKEQHLRHYKIEKSKKVGKNFLMMKSRVEDHLNHVDWVEHRTVSHSFHNQIVTRISNQNSHYNNQNNQIASTASRTMWKCKEKFKGLVAYCNYIYVSKQKYFEL